MKYLVVSVALLILSACNPAANNDSTANKNGSKTENTVYVNPKNYEDHRAQQNTIESAVGTIAYTDHGNPDAKHTLVMLHGVPTSSWMYRSMLGPLSEQLRVVSIDLFGYGSSAKVGEADEVFEPASHAKIIKTLLEDIGIEQYSILMHDMGGLVAWELLRSSAPVENLVVLNTIVQKDGFNPPEFSSEMVTKLYAESLAMEMSSSMMLQSTFESLGLSTSQKLTEEECAGYVIPIKEGSEDALYSFFNGLNDSLYSRLDSHTPTLEAFKGQTLVVWGAKDKILTTDQLPYLQKTLNVADENMIILNDVDHFVAEEAAEETVAHIIDFFNKI